MTTHLHRMGVAFFFVVTSLAILLYSDEPNQLLMIFTNLAVGVGVVVVFEKFRSQPAVPQPRPSLWAWVGAAALTLLAIGVLEWLDSVWATAVFLVAASGVLVLTILRHRRAQGSPDI